MRYLISLLLIFSFGFAQKTTVIKKINDDEKKIEVKVNIEDDKVLYTVTEDGKTEEFEADLDNEDAMANIHKKLEDYGIDKDVKVHRCNKVKSHDCKKENCDPKTCTHAKRERCKNETIVLNTIDGCDDKKVKIIKKYKMLDEKTGFLGVQIQDLSEQLSEYFKVIDGNGVLVSEVVEDSPAKNAGLKAGDVIIKINNEDIKNADDLTTIIRSYEPETKVSVAIIRGGKKKKLEATLGETEQNYFHKFGDLGDLGDNHKKLLKMHPERLEEFQFHGLPFDKEEFQGQIDEMREELSEMKEELKKLLKEN